MSRAGMRALNKKNKELAELFKLGRQYDRETDPEKKEALKQEIEARCAALKMNLQGSVPKETASAAEEPAAEVSEVIEEM